MATLREIRRRIGGVKSTQKITKAMKMVAAARLRRAQDGVLSARPYARTMSDLLQHLAGKVNVSANQLFEVRPVYKVAIIVVTADRGLCGAFNTNVMRTVSHHILKNYEEINNKGNLHLITVGRKGSDFFQKNNYRIADKHVGIFSGLKFDHANAIAGQAVEGFLNGAYDRVELVYNEFKSIMHQNVVIEQVLPIPTETIAQASAVKQPASQIDYIYEPSNESILSSLVPKHLRFQVWRALLESNAAEQGARMTAMDNATTNASDLIRDLQLSYNKARQASITKELLEIVGGAEALTASD